MNKKNKFPLIAVSLLVLTLSLGAMAFAPSPVADPGEGFGPGDGNGRGGAGDSEHLADALGITVEELQAVVEEVRANSDGAADFNEALAAALGISVDAFESARDIARDAALAQALSDGQITQEEYELIQARQAVQDYTDHDTMLADALGITVAELQAAQEAGQRIPDLLDELGIDQETFQADIQSAQDAAFGQAVADGVITQEQADQIQEGGGRGPSGRGPGEPGQGGQGGPGDQGGQGGPGQGGQGGPGQGGPGGQGPGNQGGPGSNNG